MPNKKVTQTLVRRWGIRLTMAGLSPNAACVWFNVTVREPHTYTCGVFVSATGVSRISVPKSFRTSS